MPHGLHGLNERMKKAGEERRRNRGAEFPQRRPIAIRNEDDYERLRDRARDLHARGSANPLVELELERLAVAMLEWELKRGAPEG